MALNGAVLNDAVLNDAVLNDAVLWFRHAVSGSFLGDSSVGAPTQVQT
jgi:hypothetical protein